MGHNEERWIIRPARAFSIPMQTPDPRAPAVYTAEHRWCAFSYAGFFLNCVRDLYNALWAAYP